MANEEYRRLVPGAKTAVLFLHGIVGSPEHFRAIVDLEALVPAEYSVFNLCYPGHGGKVTDFGKSDMFQWKEHVWKAFGELSSQHEHIILVGHSMGTLFALQLAARYPEKVGSLFLLQVPLYVGLRWHGIYRMLKFPFGWLKKDDPYEASIMTACGVMPDPWIYKYTPWILRVYELLRQMRQTRKVLTKLKAPAIAIQCRRDELVANKSARVLRKSGTVEVLELPASSHFYYNEEEQRIITEAFLKQIT